MDDNKRRAFVTAVTFLRLNGHAFRPETIDGVRMMEDRASGKIGEGAFAEWRSPGMKPI